MAFATRTAACPILEHALVLIVVAREAAVRPWTREGAIGGAPLELDADPHQALGRGVVVARGARRRKVTALELESGSGMVEGRLHPAAVHAAPPGGGMAGCASPLHGPRMRIPVAVGASPGS